MLSNLLCLKLSGRYHIVKAFPTNLTNILVLKLTMASNIFGCNQPPEESCSSNLVTNVPDTFDECQSTRVKIEEPQTGEHGAYLGWLYTLYCSNGC